MGYLLSELNLHHYQNVLDVLSNPTFNFSFSTICLNNSLTTKVDLYVASRTIRISSSMEALITFGSLRILLPSVNIL